MEKPEFSAVNDGKAIKVEHYQLGTWYLHGDEGAELLFTENETKGKGQYAKDGMNEYLVHGKKEAVNPEQKGTKSAFHYTLKIPPNESKEIHLRLTKDDSASLKDIGKILKTRLREAEEFYEEILPSDLSDEHRLIARQAYAGLLWNKMYYNLVIPEWLKGDEGFNPPLPLMIPAKLAIVNGSIFTQMISFQLPISGSSTCSFLGIRLFMHFLLQRSMPIMQNIT